MEIVRQFGDFGAAERARAELLAVGIAEDCVKLEACKDEAGPGESNFTVGNDPAVVGGDAYKRTFEPRPTEGHYLMIVAAADDGQADRAAEIMARHGATSGDPADHPSPSSGPSY